ncbi:MAG: SLC13 family permease, partial [Dehalococcoidales bacterium]|nr:SLC13 family permease [Dehalococcoidales bacterium]
ITLITGKVPRHIPATIAAALMVLVVLLGIQRSPEAVWRTLNLGELVRLHFWVPGREHIESHGINWQTIIFIAGMMIMILGLEKQGFFRWICLVAARLVGCRVMPLVLAFMFISGFLAMFVDSITVLLFLARVTIELGRLLKFDPVPVIVAEIVAANTGGAATMSGDPPNIIIGTALGYTFMDFAVNTGVIAWACMVFAMIYFYVVLRQKFRHGESAEELMKVCPLPSSAIFNRRLFIVHTAIFIITIILIVTHAETGLSVALIGVIAAILTLLADPSSIKDVVRVDGRTILFFISLFICVSVLEETGILETIAGLIRNISGGNVAITISVILWISAVASSIVDNIPFAATMIPVIRGLAAQGSLEISALAWTLALGTDIGGNATPIGASANVVGTAVAHQEGYPLGWGRYMKYALVPTIVSILICQGILLWRYA